MSRDFDRCAGVQKLDDGFWTCGASRLFLAGAVDSPTAACFKRARRKCRRECASDPLQRPGWMIVTVLSRTTMVPVLGAPVLFGATVKFTRVSPFWGIGVVMVIHAA